MLVTAIGGLGVNILMATCLHSHGHGHIGHDHHCHNHGNHTHSLSH